MHVTGVSGTTYATRVTDQQGRSFSRFAGAKYPIMHDMGGPSDILASMTAAQVLTAMETYHTAAKAAGAYKTIASTMTPMTAAWSYTGAMETQRLALNEGIRASTVWDAVSDLASVPESADPANTTYYQDGLHPKSVLAELFADEITAAVNSIWPT